MIPLPFVISGFFVVITIMVVKFFKWLFKSELEDDRGHIESWYGREFTVSEDEDEFTKLYEGDPRIHPFTIDIKDDVLEDLKRRLKCTRLQEPIEGVNFTYGFNPEYLKTLVAYWSDVYDWRKHERELNSQPQFLTTIEGIEVHFLHAKPAATQGKRVVPLMIIHGWPGCFAEFYKVIPLLTTPAPDRDFVFEVVCPSIPGYTFSEAPHRTGFNSRDCGRFFMRLMYRLGHDEFFVQGGDWGSNIATNMARYYPDRILGLHINMFAFGLTALDAVKYLVVALFPSLVSKEEYRLVYPVRKKLLTYYEETAYFHMQSTKPDTLGCALSDSPAGLAAYLLEKFSVATNVEYVKRKDGGLTEKFTLDELLTNCTLYWVTNSFASGARFYKENLKHVATRKHERRPVTVPTGVAVFPHEVLMYPKMMLRGQLKNIVSYNIMPRGGHFAAMEEPKLFADDIWNFVNIVLSKGRRL